MSEVQDACQVIMIGGQGAYLLGNIAVKTAYEIMKLMNTLYLSKWKGVTTLNRFRAIKGDDYMFLNVSTEDPAILQRIEEEMGAHGILTARLPDLCGGDGRTQYVFSPSDVSKCKAFLLDHAHGKYKDIKVGEISPEDYASTRKDQKGEDTPEYQALQRSAKEALREQAQLTTQRPAGLLTMQKESVHAWTAAGARPEDRNVSFRTAMKPERERLAFQPLTPAVRHQVIRHDAQVNRDACTLFIYDRPFKRHSRWKMFEMPDGIHAVIVPNENTWEPTKDGFPCQAVLQKGQYYDVIELATGNSALLSAEQVAEQMKGYGIRRENEELKNLISNRNLPEAISPERERQEEDYRTDKVLRSSAVSDLEREDKTGQDRGKPADARKREYRTQEETQKKQTGRPLPRKPER